jgi:hypothetical protein
MEIPDLAGTSDQSNALIDVLAKAGLTLQVDEHGNVVREGLMVTRVQDGYLVHNLSKELEPRSLTKDQIKALIDKFPKLKPVLARNADTMRRVQFLQERYNSMGEKNFFTLDPKRPMPPSGTPSVNDVSKVPRFYGNIDESDPERPIISIFGSELGTKSKSGTRRPDEAMFSFEIEKAHAQELRATGTIDEAKAVLQKVTARNVRVIYYDDNAIITGQRAEEHALKMFDTLEVWTVHVIDTFKLRVRGEVYIHSLEDLVLQPGVRVGAEGAKTARMKVDFQQPGEEVMTNHFSMKLSVKETAKGAQVEQVAGEEFAHLSEVLSKTSVDAPKKRSAQLAKSVETALTKFK